jgi:hypothetical protein
MKTRPGFVNPETFTATDKSKNPQISHFRNDADPIRSFMASNVLISDSSFSSARIAFSASGRSTLSAG